MMDLWMIETVAPLFYKVLELSVAGVCIGLGVLLVRKLADKKISPFWKNALWLLVLVALVVPYRPQRTTAVLPPVAVEFRQQELDLRQEQVDMKVETDNLYETPPEVVTQIEAHHTKSNVFEIMIPALWLLGMAVMMGILLATRQKMLRGMRADAIRSYNVLLDDCKRQLNITQTVEIVEQSYLKSPALYGLFHPKILLPDYVADLSEDSQRYILLHELSHLKYWDLWKNALLLALQVVYWFNPLVWVLFRFIRQDMELLNDERVLKILQKEEQTPYARSLVEVLGHANRLPLAPQMLCMVDDKDNTKRRIQMIQLGEKFKRYRIVISLGCLVIIGVLSALFLTSQPTALDWAHKLDKDDIEKVELYWMEQGQEDLTFLLDENQRATLAIMLNNLYGEETENVMPSQGKSAQYSIYLTDGTVETISFLPLNEEACFFRLGWDGFMGDQYQMDDWMGLTESITTQNAVAQPEVPTTPPEITEVKKVIHTQLADVTHDGIDDVIETSITTPSDVQDKSLEALLNMTIPCDIAVYDTTLSTNKPIYQQSYGAPHTGNGQLSLVEIDGLSYLLEGSLYAGQGYYTFAHSMFSLDSQGDRQVKAEDSAEGQLSDGDAASKINTYFSNLTPWIEGATAIAILDINLENQMVSTEDETYLAKDYYQAMCAYYHSQMAFAPQPLLDLANDLNVTIVDYIPMDDMAYGQVGIVCYIEGEGDTVWISYLTQEYESKAGIGADGSASPLSDSKLTYLGNGVCEIDLLSHTTEEEVTFTVEYWPNDGEVPGTNFKISSSDYVAPEPQIITWADGVGDTAYTVFDTYAIGENGNLDATFTISDSMGHELQTIAYPTYFNQGWYNTYIDDGGVMVRFLDVDLDGDLDFVGQLHGAVVNQYYSVWRNEDDQFAYSEEYSGLSNPCYDAAYGWYLTTSYDRGLPLYMCYTVDRGHVAYLGQIETAVDDSGSVTYIQRMYGQMDDHGILSYREIQSETVLTSRDQLSTLWTGFPLDLEFLED